MKEITTDEYNKAYETVRRYEYQQKPKTIQVSIDYKATVSVTVQVPAEWDIKKIKEELKDGWYGFKKDDEERTHLEKISRLIVDGDIIK